MFNGQLYWAEVRGQHYHLKIEERVLLLGVGGELGAGLEVLDVGAQLLGVLLAAPGTSADTDCHQPASPDAPGGGDDDGRAAGRGAVTGHHGRGVGHPVVILHRQ